MPKLNKKKTLRVKILVILNFLLIVILMGMLLSFYISSEAAVEVNNWDFNQSGDYAYDHNSILFAGGKALLTSAVTGFDSNNQTSFDAGNYSDTKWRNDHVQLSDNEIVSNFHVLALYHLNETSGSVVDSSSYGNNAVNNGATSGVVGVFDKAYQFNGTSSYLNIPADLGDPDEMTLELWVNITNKNSGARYLMDARNNGNWWFLQDYTSGNCTDSNGNICFNGLVEIKSTAITSGQWHHVALTQNATETKIYLDGVLKDTGAGVNPNLGADVRIGTRYTNNAFFGGMMDEIVVWDTVLTASVIADHAQAGYKTSGQYTSEIFDAGKKVSWQDISWNQNLNLPIWYNQSWDKRKEITIDNSTNSEALTDYQIRIPVSYDGDMQPDFDDIYFTDFDHITLLDYWLETKVDSTSAVFWVKIPQINANSTKSIDMYYGNPAVSSNSNGSNTFVFFDDFSGTVIDNTKWTLVDTGNNISQNEQLIVNGGNNNWTTTGLVTKNQYARDNLIMECYINFTGGTHGPMWGYKDTDASINYTNFIYALYNTQNNAIIYEDGINKGDTGYDFTLGTPYYLRTKINKTTGAVYYLSTDGQNYTQLYSSNYSTETPGHFGITNYNKKFVMDDFRLRKTTTPEPAVSFGSEIPRVATGVKVQVRSCNDTLCNGEVFVGSDNTADTYFTDFTGSTVSVAANRYFQYKIYFNTYDPSFTPEVSSVHINSILYDQSRPEIISNLNFAPGQVSLWDTFTETSVKESGAEIYYQLSDDNGSTYYYWDGGAWRNSALGLVGDANTRALWHLEDISGGVLDTGVNGYDGVNYGVSTGMTGRIGKAYLFDGTTGYVDFGFKNILNNKSNATWEAWIYPTSYPGTYGGVLTKWNNAIHTYWWFGIKNTGQISFWGGNGEFVSGSVIQLNHWQHIAVVKNGNALIAYLNGVEVGRNDFYNWATIGEDIDVRLLMGAKNNGSGDMFAGLIDEVVVSDRVKTLADIQNSIDFYNTATEINNNFSSFFTDNNQLNIKSFLVSDGGGQVALDNVRVKFFSELNTQVDVKDWHFIDALDYDFDSAEISIQNSNASLLQASALFVDDELAEFNGTYSQSEYKTDHLELQTGEELTNNANTKALYHFNTGSGTAISDQTSVYNGTGTNIVWTSGMWDTKALQFDGINSYVLPVSGEGGGMLDAHSSHTVEAWVRRNNNANRQVIFIEGGTGYGYALYLDDGSGNISHVIRNSTTSIDSITYPVSNLIVGKWYHIAGVWDGATGELSLYVNGQQKNTKTTTITTIPNPGNGWRLGGSGNEVDVIDGATSISLDGVLEEVKVYDTALSASQVAGDASFYLIGDYTSPIKDAGSDIFWNTIGWSDTLPPSTVVKFQVRSCDDINCDTEIFIGHDGTAGTYYSTSGASLNVINNRFFQYKMFMIRPMDTLSPELTSVSLSSLGDYSSNYPMISPKTALNVNGVLQWRSFEETAVKPVNTELYYQLSDDNGATWYWYDGAGWVNTDEGNSNDVNTVLLYHFSNTSGDIEDSSGNNITAANTGASRGQPGKYGFGLLFNGTDDSLKTVYDSKLSLLNTDFSLGFWLKTLDTDAFILKKYAGLLVGDGWGVDIVNGNLRFYDGNSWHDSLAAVNDDTWKYVVITGNNTSKQLDFYVNAHLVKTLTFNTLVDNLAPLYIGKEVDDKFFAGNLDELRISNIIKTPDEQRLSMYLYNKAEQINNNIIDFPTTSASIMFRGFLASDGSITPSLDNVRISYKYRTNFLPEASVPDSISQMTDGSGYISFQTTVSDTDFDLTRLQVEYSVDNGSNWYHAAIGNTNSSPSGSVDVNNANQYQIGTGDPIDSDVGPVTLTVFWDTKSTQNGNGSLDNLEIANNVLIRVKPFDGINEGLQVVSSGFGIDNLKPSGLANFSGLQATESSIVWKWTPVSVETNFNTYEIWYGINSGEVLSKTGSANLWNKNNDSGLAVMSQNSASIPGLAASTKYFAVIWAVDSFGNSIITSLSDYTTSSPPAISTGGGGGGSWGGGGGWYSPSYPSPVALKILINNGDIKTNSTGVALSLEANDATEMMINNSPNEIGAQTLPYKQIVNWNLNTDSGAGLKTVFVKFLNSGSVKTEWISDSIILDYGWDPQMVEQGEDSVIAESGGAPLGEDNLQLPQDFVLEEIKYVRVIFDFANVREDDTIYSKLIKKVYKGEVYPFIDESDNRVRINTGDDVLGWVHKDYIEIFTKKEEIKNSAIPSPNKKQEERKFVEIVFDFANVRESESISSELVKKVYRGEVYPLIAQGHSRVKIKISDNIVGWVHKDYIKIIKEASVSLAGMILLQVEKNGEAWYVYPKDNKRYYLGRPVAAFKIMKHLSLGVTHSFIEGFDFFPDRVSGLILLDVEKDGESYYINPKDKKKYYLNRPADAFKVMQNLGLGISNEDISKIKKAEIH